MSTFFRAISLALLLTCLTCVLDARADTVTINSGSATVGGTLGGTFSLGGNGFQIGGGLTNGPGSCSPCLAGEKISVGNINLGSDLRSGPANIGGISHEKLFYSGFLQFSAGIVVPNTSSNLFTVTTPFLLTGSMQGCKDSSGALGLCQPGDLAFNYFLTGQGTATITMMSFESAVFGRLYEIQSVRYDFAPAAVPEPATIALLSTGLMAAGAAARKRRRTNDNKNV